jgi:hypothetical protein
VVGLDNLAEDEDECVSMRVNAIGVGRKCVQSHSISRFISSLFSVSPTTTFTFNITRVSPFIHAFIDI